MPNVFKNRIAINQPLWDNCAAFHNASPFSVVTRKIIRDNIPIFFSINASITRIIPKPAVSAICVRYASHKVYKVQIPLYRFSTLRTL